jgi:hypothetical protein
MTIRLADVRITSTAQHAAFFARWADMATWPEWNLDTEWVRLDGAFVQGTTGVLKPKGGPKVPFVVARLTDDEFVDVSKLLGARLTFAHRVRTGPAGTEVTVTATLDGPLARVWQLMLGKGIRASAQPDLERLARAAEASQASEASERA